MPKAGEMGEWGVTVNGYGVSVWNFSKFSFWGDENILNLDFGSLHNSVNILMSWNYIWVNFMVCELSQ